MHDYSRKKQDMYRRYAGSYDDDRRLMIGEEALRDRALRLTEDIIADDLVLDLGCGSGDHLTLAADRVGARGRVLGLDISPEMLRQARVKTLGRTTIGLALCDLTRGVPMPDQFFDVVICANLGQEVPDLAALLREARRVVRRHGTLVATIACLDGPSEAHVAFQEAAQVHHWYYRTYREVLHAVADSGFDPLEGIVRFDSSPASHAQSAGTPAFTLFAEIMAEVRERGHDPAELAQGVAYIKLRRT
ncbi:MAG: methyltransferase domain-containing protein [Chloroflexi bacterium]|nr:methyltransferase domain-containing protein [Chloroflexota bacterium]